MKDLELMDEVKDIKLKKLKFAEITLKVEKLEGEAKDEVVNKKVFKNQIEMTMIMDDGKLQKKEFQEVEKIAQKK